MDDLVRALGLIMGNEDPLFTSFKLMIRSLKKWLTKVRKRSKCSWFFCGLFLWSYKGIKGPGVIFFPSLEKL